MAGTIGQFIMSKGCRRIFFTVLILRLFDFTVLPDARFMRHWDCYWHQLNPADWVAEV